MSHFLIDPTSGSSNATVTVNPITTNTTDEDIVEQVGVIVTGISPLLVELIHLKPLVLTVNEFEFDLWVYYYGKSGGTYTVTIKDLVFNVGKNVNFTATGQGSEDKYTFTKTAAEFTDGKTLEALSVNGDGLPTAIRFTTKDTGTVGIRYVAYIPIDRSEDTVFLGSYADNRAEHSFYISSPLAPTLVTPKWYSGNSIMHPYRGYNLGAVEIADYDKWSIGLTFATICGKEPSKWWQYIQGVVSSGLYYNYMTNIGDDDSPELYSNRDDAYIYVASHSKLATQYDITSVEINTTFNCSRVINYGGESHQATWVLMCKVFCGELVVVTLSIKISYDSNQVNFKVYEDDGDTEWETQIERTFDKTKDIELQVNPSRILITQDGTSADYDIGGVGGDADILEDGGHFTFPSSVVVKDFNVAVLCTIW